jgi:undecaprenyl diphosphate synthase
MNIPNHVAIIMDGNGRWATSRNKKRSEGHIAGAKNLESLANYAFNKGIKVLSVYAFSTDNFKRDKEEVDNLMDLLVKYFNTKLNKLIKMGIKVVVSGRRENLRNDVLDAINKIENSTIENKNGIFNICLNYGGQEEIIDACLKYIKSNKEELNRDNFYKYLYNELPPIDLLIRTGGEVRLSNFMLYQLSYAELYFSNTYFPDFNNNELDDAIDYFNNKDRRYGMINNLKK